MMILGLMWLFLTRLSFLAFSILAWPFRRHVWAELQKSQRGHVLKRPNLTTFSDN